MSNGLRELRDDDLDAALEAALTPRLTGILEARQAGHCMRITDLGAALAIRLCRRVRAAVSHNAQVYVLGESPDVPAEVGVSSTKLVELRNPDARGRQRPPLLAFVPPGTHASAEDSFGIATFEELNLGDVYHDLAGRIRRELPLELGYGIDSLFTALNDQKWAYSESYARARYLLTIRLNENDPVAAGAALFELGLIPDFDLFKDPAQVLTRAARNVRQMQILNRHESSERSRVIELQLSDTDFQSKLAAFVVGVGLEDPREWTRRIVVDRANWRLAFQHWPLRVERPVQEIRITVGEVDLPRAGDRPEHAESPALRNLTGQLFLIAGKQGPTQLPLTFQVAPDPRQVPGLVKFSVQLWSEEFGQTGVASAAVAGKTGKTSYKTTLKKLRAANLEEGWHFVRVVPLDDEGLPMATQPGPNDEQPLNESDRFFVIVDDEMDDPPPQNRAGKDIGVTHALRRLGFAALADGRDWRAIHCRSVAWKSAQGAGRNTLVAAFGAHGSTEIGVSPALADLQRAILGDPDSICRWRLPIKGGQADAPTPELLHWSGEIDGDEKFLATRAALFAAIRGAEGLIVEGADFNTLRDLIHAYAMAYWELLRARLQRAERAGDDELPAYLRGLNALLQIDTVEADCVSPEGIHRLVTIVAPTHPLRLLWLATWAELGRHWLDNAAENDPDALNIAWHTLVGMTPLGFPIAVPRDGRQLSIAASDLSPFWGVCLPTDTDDPQGLLAELAAGLRLPDRWLGGQAVSGRQLANRVARYVMLHPYVGTLVISAVNAGSADHLADMLVDLASQKETKDVNFDLRLFTHEPNAQGQGDALAALLRGEWSTAAAAEAFHTRSKSGIVPKLAVAIRPLSEFRAATSEHPAHVTFLFDAFSGETFTAARGEEAAMTPVHGLRQDVTVIYAEDVQNTAEETDGERATWRKLPRHGPAYPIPGAEEFSDLLAALPQAISAAAAAVTTGEVGTGLVPQVTLALTPQDNTLLHQAHRSSDWVVTVDRTLGVEYFDRPSSEKRPDYVIDFDVESAEGLGHHIVVSSRSVDELRALMAPVIAQHGLTLDPRHTTTFFDQLRLLSGRLAFKLASAASTAQTEVLGLSLARLFLDYQGVLADQIVIPLDAHLELYRGPRQRVDEVGEAIGFKRADLALFGLNARNRTLTCRLVEVKCYRNLSAYPQLKEEMTKQVNESAAVLAEHFDPRRTQPDRPDRAVKNAELATLLRSYLGRAVRHGTMRADAAREAQWMLDRLDGGYRLEFTRTGLVFDLASNGSGLEVEDGIEFHRVGKNLAEELIEAVPTDPVLDSRATSATLGALALSVPRLTDAAFRAPTRTHEVPDDPILPVDPDEDLAPAVDDDLGSSRIEPTAQPQEPEIPEDLHVGSDPALETSMKHPVISELEAVRQPESVRRPETEPPDIFLGSSTPSPQYGVLGEIAGRRIALDLNETHTISLFGVQGGGKSYTLGSIIEAASLAVPLVNELPHPLATIVFHYSPTLDYAPEFTSMVAPNDNAAQIALLRERYGAAPAALQDVVMLVPADQLDQRRAEYPSIEVLPLKFGSSELRAEHWRFLMGAIGNQSTYIRQLQRIMKAHRNDLRLEIIRHGVEQSGLSDNLKQLAQQRLDLAEEYIDDGARVKELVRPGRMIIVDLRDEFIEKDEALGLFVVLMQLFAEAQDNGRRFNKLVVFDEAHKYIESPDLVAGLVESVREMRHKGMSVLVASQDPPSVPISLIELSNHVILHKFTSPAWLKHLQKANASLADLTSTKMAALAPGEAYIWSSKATDSAFTRGAVRVRFRPRITRHGGGTKTAVS
ncbi:methylation-associated defense system ATP-binding protein MAD8 [Nonomuraea sp. KM90]|uniref:methylation-associated defense system ATP-binding protein MAD8 n=1 Tax=Nonomuraea sp. KM90 TaxID=3457428 RepID=UPI003FCCAA6D